MNKSSYVFGPVPSRRLGRSLGIDLVPLKTCSYDCIYCQLGRTTHRIVERREWVPLEAVFTELKEKLSIQPDYITLSGSGEPTLYSRIDELIGLIRSTTDIPIAVLTNGSLLWQEDVRRQIADAHLVIPSLDAGDEFMFHAINRPHPDLTFEKVIEGLAWFRLEYSGQFWLEIFLLAGYTAIPAEVDKLVECVKNTQPDKVQLNSVTRSPAEEYAIPVERCRLQELASKFDPPAEVVADFHNVHNRSEFQVCRDEIIQVLRRRPCTSSDIATAFDIHPNEVAKHIEELMMQGLLKQSRINGEMQFYYSELLSHNK